MKAGIVGGGIMGRLLAFLLVNNDWEVTVFDKNDINNCSMAAAGLLTPTAELENSTQLIYHLGVEASKSHWPDIIQHLQDDIYFQNRGSLMFAHSRDKSELSRLLTIISSKVSTNGIYHKLSHSQIKDLEPDIYKFEEGYFFPNEGQIDNQTLLVSLKKYLMNKNIRWLDSFVSAVEPHKIYLSNAMFEFDVVFDCRGLGGKSYFADLRGIRGELIWLHNPDIHLKHPIRILHPRYKLYISPRPDHVYIIGASEIESEDSSSISVKTMLELLSAVYSLHPSFSEARVLKTITQCRPTLTNHLPKIKYTSGLLTVNGLYRHGFLIAPSLAEDIMRYLKQGTVAIHFPEIWEKLNK